MRRIVWLTDIHLNFVRPADLREFYRRIADARPDVLLVGGDIAEATSVVPFLHEFAAEVARPVYYVLGNHDYYYGSIAAVRAAMRELTETTVHLRWLPASGVVELAPGVGLVGHDGWADARFGDYDNSAVMMHDYTLIAELAAVRKGPRRKLLHDLGNEAAAHVRATLRAALDLFPQVFVLTHIPPFREACWHQGAISNDEWLPHFTCRAVGEAIVEVAAQFPDRRVTVLCGHTHSPGEYRPADNVLVLTGRSDYGQPEIQRTWELS